MEKKSKRENKNENKRWLFLGGAIFLLVIVLSLCFVFLGKRNDLQGGGFNATVLPAGSAVKIKMIYFSDPYYDVFSASSSDPITLDVVSEESKKQVLSGSTLMQMFKTTDGGIVYCIEKGNPAAVASNPNRDLTGVSNSNYWKKLTSDQQELMSLITIYGYPNKDRNGYTEEEEYAATQILLWEVQQKWRTNADSMPKNKELYSRWILDSRATKVKAVYDAILQDMREHNKVASFSNTNSSALTATSLKYNASTKKYEATLIDSNGMLANSKVTCPTELSCTHSGNSLIVSASAYSSATKKITITKSVPNGLSQGMLIIENKGYQKMFLGKGSVDSVVSYASVVTETLGTLKIKKASEDGAKQGFKFKISGPNNYSQTLTTNSDGEITISNLPLGEYTISEIEVPAKYEQPASQKVQLSTTEADKTITFNNVLVNNSTLVVTKIDAETKEMLSGAKLEIRKGSEVIEKWVTDGNSYKVKKTLDVNVAYNLCETEAPAGYVKNTTCKEFKITDKNQKLTLEFENNKTTTTISKLDENNKLLGGANLQLLTADGKEIEKWTSVANQVKVVKGLVVGQTYILRETSAPEGYMISTDVKFVAKEDNKVQMVNKKTSVEISKQDITSSKEIAGAHLQVLDSNNAIVDEWDSEEGKKHIIRGLIVGNSYTLKETIAPDGYVVANDVKFTVLATGVTKVTMKNELSTTEFSKQDATTGEEIAGAHLQLFDSDGNLIEEWDSEEGKKHIIRGLVVGNSYTLKETIAPDGYALTEEVVFIAGSHEKVIMKDDPTTVVVYKKDVVSEKTLAGAHLQLLDSEGNIIDEWDTTEEAHVINKLLTGKEYTIIETEAPKDYLKTEEIKFSLDVTEAKKEIVVYNTPIVYVPDTSDNVSLITIAIGGLLVAGGTGMIIWMRKRRFSH